MRVLLPYLVANLGALAIAGCMTEGMSPTLSSDDARATSGVPATHSPDADGRDPKASAAPAPLASTGAHLAAGAGNPAAYARSDGASSVLHLDSANHIKELFLIGPSWGHGDLTASAGAPAAAGNPAAYVRSDQVNSVVFRGADGHIRELFLLFGSGAWGVSDLTAITGAPAASGDPSGYVRSDGVNAVVYRSNNGHIQELSIALGSGHWGAGDLTALAGAPLAAGDPVGYARAGGTNSVVYRGVDGHIHELFLGAGWGTGDLTALTGAVSTVGNPSAHVRSDGVDSVVYRGTDNHIHELFFVPGRDWGTGDLTSLTGAAPAAGNPSAYTRADGIDAIVFRSTDNHVRELYLAGGWGTGDLTALTGAPNSVSDPRAYVRADGVSDVVFRSADSHVHELYFLPDWRTADLTLASGE